MKVNGMVSITKSKLIIFDSLNRLRMIAPLVLICYESFASKSGASLRAGQQDRNHGNVLIESSFFVHPKNNLNKNKKAMKEVVNMFTIS